ncbi:CgeB family protein [Paenibacillus glufosinatiresistens]|uniref:glycosyltransferase family protein n=1 Tax=Paenibacillus glufosinatiresistens TaxID=3070657 RepID=UPI00286E59F6|nr:glycosyltransferase [Paenibacillus sp. YX.27]
MNIMPDFSPSSPLFRGHYLRPALRPDSERQRRRSTPLRNWKELRILLIAPERGPASSLVPVLEEPLRHLLRDVVTIKYTHSLERYLGSSRPELVLVTGDGCGLPERNLRMLAASGAVRAAWVSDEETPAGFTPSPRPLFDFIFTQRYANLTNYRVLCTEAVHYLPLPPDTALYRPRPANAGFRSDILIVEGNYSNGELNRWLEELPLEGKKVLRIRDGTLPLAEEADYFSGARMVINASGKLGTAQNVSACGTFQLIRDDPALYDYTANNPALAVFHSGGKLRELFYHYWEDPDRRRTQASRALADLRYNRSGLNQSMKLLTRLSAVSQVDER